MPKAPIEATRSRLWSLSTEELDAVYAELTGSGKAIKIDVLLSHFDMRSINTAINDTLGEDADDDSQSRVIAEMEKSLCERNARGE